uniref:F-box domain-containing protein n=1 Tax=Panagrellus redivivus TaxID=6233 RepID=A0A7E4V5L9_PANRE
MFRSLLSFIYSYFYFLLLKPVEPPKVYPLSKFAYSFQRRLRELATPKEAYHLQLADIDQTATLKPKIYHYGPVDTMVWHEITESLTLLNEELSFESDLSTLHDVTECLWLFNVDSTIFQHRLFYQSISSLPPQLEVWRSTIDDAFLTEYASIYRHFSGYEHVFTINSSQFALSNNLFDHIKELKFPDYAIRLHSCEKLDWITYLLNCKECNLKSISLRGSFDEVTAVDVLDVLLHFYFLILKLVEPPKVYPLSKFAYSFQRRLRELATPKEAYHLQLADIDQTATLKPKIYHYGPVDTMVWHESLVESDLSTLHDVTECLMLSNVNSTIFQRRYFYQLTSLPPQLEVWHSTIDDAFLTEYASIYKHFSGYKHVFAIDTSQFGLTNNFFDHIKDVNFPDYAIRFNFCKNLDWITYLLDCKECNVNKISIMGSLDEVLWNANAENFAKIFTSPKCKYLQIDIVFNLETWEDVAETVLSVLSDNFVEDVYNFNLFIMTYGQIKCFNYVGK